MTYLAKTPEGLLPCPFCGGEAEFETYGGTACAVTCRKCRCGTPTVSLNDGERAVEAWNRRAERTCHIKLSKTSVWHCDGCGQTIDGNCFADNGGRLVEYRYCPNCGARVVDE